MNGIELVNEQSSLTNGLLALAPIIFGVGITTIALIRGRGSIAWAGVGLIVAGAALGAIQSSATGRALVEQQHTQVAEAYGLTAPEVDVLFDSTEQGGGLFIPATRKPSTLLVQIDGAEAKLTLRRIGNYVAILRDGTLVTTTDLRAALK